MMNFIALFFFCIYLITWFLPLLLIMWLVTLTNLQILNCFCIPKIKLTWSWCLIISEYCWIQFAHIFLRILTSMLVKDIGLQFSCGILIWFWYQSKSGPITWVWKTFIFFYCLESFKGLVFIHWIFGRIHQWSYLVLGGFSWLIQSPD